MQQQITNTKIVMPKKPIGLPNESNFKIINEDLRDLEEKEVLVKTLWLSLDPYMRGTMNRIDEGCLLYTSPSPRDKHRSRMPSSA